MTLCDNPKCNKPSYVIYRRRVNGVIYSFCDRCEDYYFRKEKINEEKVCKSHINNLLSVIPICGISFISLYVHSFYFLA